MTAIAYRDGVMAADSGVWQGNILAGRDTAKIRRLKDGRLAGFAGRHSDIEAVVDWLEEGAAAGRRPPAAEQQSFAALVVSPMGSMVWRIEYDFRPYPAPQAEFYAIGCHNEFLLGAMAAGATAEQAVELACRYGDGAVGPVQVEHIDPRILRRVG